jgi:hypothetical protein
MSPKDVPLVFSDARMAFLYPFLVKNIPEDKKLVKQIQKVGLEVKTESEGIRNFKIAEAFGLTKDYIENTLTLEVSGFEMEVPGIGVDIPVKVFMRIQKHLKCCILYFTFKFPKSTTDDLIFLKQGIKVLILSAPEPIRKLMVSGEKSGLRLKDIFRKYRTLVSRVLAAEFEGEIRSCIEIREILNSIDNPREVLDKYPKQMYGLMVSDEGWRFVPEDYAKERIFESCWSSRNYFVVMAHASGTFNLNFRESKARKKYTASQKLLRDKYDYPIEDYFIYDFEIAGAENGGLLGLELTMIEDVILSSLYVEKIPEKPLDIVKLRKRIVDGVGASRHVRIPGVGVSKKLREEISMPRYEELVKKVGEIDRAIEITFSEARYEQDAKISSRMQILNVIFSGAVGLTAAAFLTGATMPGTDIVITEWVALIIGLVLWAIVATIGIEVTNIILKRSGVLR